MKLYGAAMPAPNPRRVRMFLAEKGLRIEEQALDLRGREHKRQAHLERNTLGQVPTLVLDDGTAISETLAICRYIEETHPDPPLMGRTPLEKALSDMWVRRVEFTLMAPVGHYWRHAHPLTARLVEQHGDFGRANAAVYARAQMWLDGELKTRPFLAGEAFGIADIVLISVLDFADWIGLPLAEEALRLTAWRKRVAARPSAAA